MRKIILAPAVLLFAICTNARPPQTMPKMPADTASPATPKKLTVADKVKSSKKMEGLFTIYQDTTTGTVQLYIKKSQLGKKFIYQSLAENGPGSIGLGKGHERDNAVISFKKYYDRIEFQRLNTSYWYDKNNPVSKADDVNKPESIFFVEKIAAEDSSGYLVAADGLFISEKLDNVRRIIRPGTPPESFFNLGALNPAKSQYYKIRSYPDNTDVVVDLAYDNLSPFNGGADDIVDARFNRVRIQHTFIEVPENSSYKPRMDDPRVGYYAARITDLTSIKPTPYHDLIHRWNLQKKDPSAALSEPVKPIVWWIENTTPYEYRQTIKEAGEKWNEAFEKAGFKNAVVMKMQPDDADWDAGDIRYNVIRGFSSPYPWYGGYGSEFENPLTGEILGADIMIEWSVFSAYGLSEEIYNSPGLYLPEILKYSASCTLASELNLQYVMGLTALEATGAPETELKEVRKQSLYYMILHEIGHSMGLYHNFQASQMLSPAQINDTSITRVKGLYGSVMDYSDINVSLDRSRQGDYFTTRPGPYDLWAIEFGYTPTANEAEEKAFRKKVLSRSTEPDLAFGNDADDMRRPGKAIDPRVNVWDMTNDAVAYAEDRFKLINNLIPKLKDKFPKIDESYAELTKRYGFFNFTRSKMTAVVGGYIGGVYVDRSFVGQTTPTKPFTPVPLAYQKKAMSILAKYVFAPNAFDADKRIFPYLQLQRRGHNFFSTTEDPKITTDINNISNAALLHILHPVTLQRITNSRIYGNEYSATDVMNDLTKAIFDADLSGNVNVYRQYLQTTFIKSLTAIILEKSLYDDVAKSAAHYSLKKIKAKLSSAVSSNEETKAHRGSLVYMIDKAVVIK